MNKTTIEWTDYTWNPVTGCHKVSRGCKNCYAEVIANRFWKGRSFRDVQMHSERLNEPLGMRHKLHDKSVFVCDVSDLFHEDVSFEFIREVWKVFVQMPYTYFQVLTKRPDRALEWYKWQSKIDGWLFRDPPANVWIGTSCEDQAAADERIPLLLQIPATVRFLSCEPLVGSIDLQQFLFRPVFHGSPADIEPNNQLHWIIAGGESGHGATPMHPDWVRSLREQCKAANVPFFFKQWGEWRPALHGEIVPLKGSKFIRNDGNVFDLPFGIEAVTGKPEPITFLPLIRLGKSKAGNLLDGVQHLEFPA